MRIGNFFIVNDTTSFTFDQAKRGVMQLFDEDLDEIIAQSFDKLDITDENILTVKYIRQGLLVNGRTHVNKTYKALNKALLEHVYNMRSAESFSRTRFENTIREIFRQHSSQPLEGIASGRQFEQAASGGLGDSPSMRYHESGGPKKF